MALDDAGRRRNGVLLSGYYGCGNLGDDLLLTVAVEELRAILPDARFLLRDHGAALPNLGPDVIPTGVDAILGDQTRSRLYRLAGFTRHIAGLLRQCRWLIFGGGTVFHDSGGLASLALQWLICHLARALRRADRGAGRRRRRPADRDRAMAAARHHRALRTVPGARRRGAAAVRRHQGAADRGPGLCVASVDAGAAAREPPAEKPAVHRVDGDAGGRRNHRRGARRTRSGFWQAARPSRGLPGLSAKRHHGGRREGIRGHQREARARRGAD